MMLFLPTRKIKCLSHFTPWFPLWIYSSSILPISLSLSRLQRVKPLTYDSVQLGQGYRTHHGTLVDVM
jgi:hypothetical protein